MKGRSSDLGVNMDYWVLRKLHRNSSPDCATEVSVMHLDLLFVTFVFFVQLPCLAIVGKGKLLRGRAGTYIVQL